MRRVPSDDEAVPFLPHIFPNVGVGMLEESSLRLQNCRLTVGSDCCVPGCVLQEKRQGERLPLHNIAPSWQHLGDATRSEGATVKGAGNNSGRHDPSAGVFRGARGVGAKDQVAWRSSRRRGWKTTGTAAPLPWTFPKSESSIEPERAANATVAGSATS